MEMHQTPEVARPALTRREFIGGVASATLAAGAAALGKEAPQRRANILWIMTDQQPVSTLGCYGNALSPTPAVDRLAREGMRFDAFHISAFPCSPSRACFFTGRESHAHGVVVNDVLLEEAIPTLGDVCKAAGYDTAYFGKWHLGGMMYRVAKGKRGGHAPHGGRWFRRRVKDPEVFKFRQLEGGFGEDASQQGFEEWAGGWAHYHAYLREVGLGKLVGDPPRCGNHNDLPSASEGRHMFSRLPEEHHMAAFFRKRAAAFLRKRKGSDRPFCMVVSFYGPHLPVAPPKPWDTRYSLDQVKLPANHRDDLRGKPFHQRSNRRCYQLGRWRDEQFLDYIRRYYGYCAYLDAQVGHILKALDEIGQADDTIVVYTSDHGDMVAAHGFVFKLCWCGYDELLRVPFVMRYPRVIKPRQATAALVSGIDPLPTILELAGLGAPAGVTGRSFRPLLEGRTKSHREHVVCNSAECNLTLHDGRWKYVLNWKRRDLDELYDTEGDPGEMKNLAYDSRHARRLAAMRDLTASWLKEAGHPYAKTVTKAMATEPPKPIEARPVVTHFRHLGGNKFEFGYEWRVGSGPKMKEKYWSFCQFLKGRQIAFRLVRWPKKPTPEWKQGDVVKVGPAVIEVPAGAKGRHDVVIGLWEPKKRTWPLMVGAQGNRHFVGRLTIRRAGKEIKSITFKASDR